MPSCIVSRSLSVSFVRDPGFSARLSTVLVPVQLVNAPGESCSSNHLNSERELVSFFSCWNLALRTGMNMMNATTLCFLLFVAVVTPLSVESNPEYVKQCSRSDPKLKACLIDALHHLRPYLSVGIPEIELPSVEPFRMDELTLSLTGGTNGYKVQLRELFVKGASNYTVDDIKLGSPFEAIVRMPALILDAHYSSSGVLIILPASGNGTFHARFDDVKALVKGTVSTKERDGKTFLNVDNLDVVLEVKNVHMRVRKIFNNNRILTEATNLFLRENGQEVLKVMEPQLKRKLSVLFAGIVNQLLRHVPVEVFLLP